MALGVPLTEPTYVLPFARSYPRNCSSERQPRGLLPSAVMSAGYTLQLPTPSRIALTADRDGNSGAAADIAACVGMMVAPSMAMHASIRAVRSPRVAPWDLVIFRMWDLQLG